MERSRFVSPWTENGNCHSAFNSWPRSVIAARLPTSDTPVPPAPQPRCIDSRLAARREACPPPPPPPPLRLGVLAGLPGPGEAPRISGARPGPGAGESTPGMSWLIRGPRTDGRQRPQNGFGRQAAHSSSIRPLLCFEGARAGASPETWSSHIRPPSARSSASPHVRRLSTRAFRGGLGEEGGSLLSGSLCLPSAGWEWAWSWA